MIRGGGRGLGRAAGAVRLFGSSSMPESVRTSRLRSAGGPCSGISVGREPACDGANGAGVGTQARTLKFSSLET